MTRTRTSTIPSRRAPRAVAWLFAAATTLGAGSALAFEPKEPVPEDPVPIDDYATKLIDSGEAFERGISVAGTARWLPLGTMFGARLAVRLGTNHELVVEAAKLALTCSNNYLGVLGGYHYVFREESMFRPYLGVLLGYIHPNTSNACASFQPNNTYGGMVAGGFRFEPIPMIGLFAEAVGGGWSQPGSGGHSGGIVALGGGLQLALPF